MKDSQQNDLTFVTQILDPVESVLGFVPANKVRLVPEDLKCFDRECNPTRQRGPTASWVSTGTDPSWATYPSRFGHPMGQRSMRWRARVPERPAVGVAGAIGAWRPGSAQQARRATSAIAAARL